MTYTYKVVCKDSRFTETFYDVVSEIMTGKYLTLSLKSGVTVRYPHKQIVQITFSPNK